MGCFVLRSDGVVGNIVVELSFGRVNMFLVCVLSIDMVNVGIVSVDVGKIISWDSGVVGGLSLLNMVGKLDLPGTLSPACST